MTRNGRPRTAPPHAVCTAVPSRADRQRAAHHHLERDDACNDVCTPVADPRRAIVAWDKGSWVVTAIPMDVVGGLADGDRG